MDRELPEEFIRRRKYRRLTTAVIAVLGIFLTFIGFRSLLTPRIEKSRIITSVAETGPLEATVSASGLVVPKYEQAISSPIETNIISVYHKAGEKIRRGDQIVKLNKEFLQLNYEKLKDELGLKKSKKLQQEISLNNARLQSEANFEISELSVRHNEEKYKREEHLFKIGGTTKGSLEEARLSLEISRRDMERLKAQIGNEGRLYKAQLTELELEIRIQENKLREIERQLEMADIKAEQDGIITWINENAGASVRPGEKVVSIADLSSFQIQASISDIHAAKLFIAAPVRIKLNDTFLNGSITAINPAVTEGIITFMVALDDNAHPLLRPNLRVEVFVITSLKKNVVRVKNGPFYNGSVDQNVFVIKKDKAVRRKVETGESNFDFVEIKQGISPGETVIVSDMRDYDNMEEIKLK